MGNGWTICFIEEALFVGFVVPGATAAIIGDTEDYEVGRHLGPRLLQLKILAKRRERLDDARDFLRRRG